MVFWVTIVIAANYCFMADYFFARIPDLIERVRRGGDFAYCLRRATKVVYSRQVLNLSRFL